MFGLSTDVNRSIRWERDKDSVVEIENAEEPQEVVQPEPAEKEPIIELDVPEQKPSRPPRMSHREIAYTKALIDKYGENYKVCCTTISI